MKEHEKNANEIEYLYNYYKGKQPVLYKTKVVRPEINNIALENHAYEFVEFKKSNNFGEPVQYIQKGEKTAEKINPAISLLNKYMESEDKSSLDKDLGEWQFIAGHAFRWADVDTPLDEDEAPFEMSIPDPRKTFVVRSSGIRGEQLFGGYYSYHSETIQSEDNQTFNSKYRVITIYTDDFMMEVTDRMNGTYTPKEYELEIGSTIVKQKHYPLLIKGQRIIEYPINSARLGIVELVMSITNAINKIKSNDLDGIDQFVQSLLVFVNQEVDPKRFAQLSALGAVEVFSNDPQKPADVKLLVNQMLHSETKIVTDDLYQNALSILGIPRLNAKASGGDTGQARILGEGWATAYQRAKQDDLSFKKSEREFLKLVLRICKADPRDSSKELKELKISDIDIKLPRDKTDNLLVKAQSLLNLLQAGVHPETAFSVVGLFGDPHDVYIKSVEFQGEDFWKKVKDFVDEKANAESNTKTKEEPEKQNKTTSASEGKN